MVITDILMKRPVTPPKCKGSVNKRADDNNKKNLVIS